MSPTTVWLTARCALVDHLGVAIWIGSPLGTLHFGKH
jgi:hypothetical protein